METIRNLLCVGEKDILRFETELLLAHALKKTRAFVLSHPEATVTERAAKNFTAFLERRKNHEPIAFIVKKREFYGREFFVSQHTLVPRPETEILVEKVLEHLINPRVFPKEKLLFPILLLDIGTGSGNIITTLVKEVEAKNISKENFLYIATDISKKALLIAKKNAKRHRAEKNIRFIQSDILENIPKKFFRNAHEIIIAANLPYLSKKEYGDAPLDVRNFEPKSALESGTSGLDHYQKLLKELRNITLKKVTAAKITLFIEISPSQKTSLERLVSGIFQKASLTCFQDLAKKWRLIEIELKTTTPR